VADVSERREPEHAETVGRGVEQGWLHAWEMVGSGDPMVNNPCRTRQER
jgi:hypothetical protein